MNRRLELPHDAVWADDAIRMLCRELDEDAHLVAEALRNAHTAAVVREQRAGGGPQSTVDVFAFRFAGVPLDAHTPAVLEDARRSIAQYRRDR